MPARQVLTTSAAPCEAMRMRGLDRYFVQINPAAQPLWPRETGDYVLHYEATITYQAEPGLSGGERIGVISGFLIDGNRALNDRAALLDECDADDQLVADYAAAFYARDGSGFKQGVIDLFEDCSWGFNLLVIGHIAIRPDHRGRRLGLLAARRVIDFGSSSGGLIACEVDPLQFRSGRSSIEFGDHPEEDKGLAVRKLARYWGHLGFKQVPGTRYYALSTDLRQPTFEQLVGPKPRAFSVVS